MIKQYISLLFQYLPMESVIRDLVLELDKSGKSLEIGCHIGGSIRYIQKISNQVTGIDIDGESVEFAKKRFPSLAQGFFQGNGENLPFANNCFDTAFLILVLHEAPSPQIIKEACRVSERVVVIDYDKKPIGFWGLFVRLMERGKIERFGRFKIEPLFEQNGFQLKELKSSKNLFRRWIFVRK